MSPRGHCGSRSNLTRVVTRGGEAPARTAFVFEDYRLLLDSHRPRNRALLRNIPPDDLKRVTRHTVPAEIHQSGRVPLPPLDNFIKDAIVAGC